jgi:hypothetical protein
MKPTSRDSNMKLEDDGFCMMGPWIRQLLDTLCVTSSLALVALGGSDLTGGFHLGTLSFGRPHGNYGAYFGYGCRIP